MTTASTLSAVQVALGACIMLYSVLHGVRLRTAVPEDLRTRWFIVLVLMTAFLFGYITHLVLFLKDPSFPLEMITGSIFLGGALFVFLVLRITGATLQALSDKDRLRQDLMEQVDTRTRHLVEVNEELEREIGQQKATEKALKESEGKYRSLVESTDDSIYVVDRDCRYRYMNRKHLNRIGASWEEIIGAPYASFHNEAESRLFQEKVEKTFSSGQSFQSEHRSMRDGNHFLQTYSPVKSSSGTVTAVTVVSKNITDRKRMEDELRRYSFTDELTGLTNRRGFFALAEHRLKLAQRMGDKHFILYVDLDNLKTINDSWGHQEGDVALVQTARILKGTFRDSDVIARIGGDEFIMGPAAIDGGNPETSRRRLRDALASFNKSQTGLYELSLSIGDASFDPAEPCSIDDLLAQADQGMYEEKRQKRLAVDAE